MIARKVDRAGLHESSLYLGVMRTGIREHHTDQRPLEKPTFRAVCEAGIWGHEEIHRFARLYTNGIFPWQ